MGKQRDERWSAFLEGYVSARAFPDLDLALIDTFVIIRDFSNIAFGLRNLQDFGHDMTSDNEIDHWCGQLKTLRDRIKD